MAGRMRDYYVSSDPNTEAKYDFASSNHTMFIMDDGITMPEGAFRDAVPGNTFELTPQELGMNMEASPFAIESFSAEAGTHVVNPTHEQESREVAFQERDTVGSALPTNRPLVKAAEWASTNAGLTIGTVAVLGICLYGLFTISSLKSQITDMKDNIRDYARRPRR